MLFAVLAIYLINSVSSNKPMDVIVHLQFAVGMIVSSLPLGVLLLKTLSNTLLKR